MFPEIDQIRATSAELGPTSANVGLTFTKLGSVDGANLFSEFDQIVAVSIGFGGVGLATFWQNVARIQLGGAGRNWPQLESVSKQWSLPSDAPNVSTVRLEVFVF